jgi:hypothetical protein
MVCYELWANTNITRAARIRTINHETCCDVLEQTAVWNTYGIFPLDIFQIMAEQEVWNQHNMNKIYGRTIA